jgi:septal ring factor EnvC (AmiA/AmiB activator)
MKGIKILQGGFKMNISSISGSSSMVVASAAKSTTPVASKPTASSNGIDQLLKQKLELEKQLNTVNKSDMDGKTKKEKIKKLDDQIQKIDTQIAKIQKGNSGNTGGKPVTATKDTANSDNKLDVTI